MNNKTTDIRQFNRFFARRLGLFDKKAFNTEYSYTESRIIEEIAFGNGKTANDIAQYLYIDKGYMSRIIAKLTEEKIITRKESKTDTRKKELSLTAKGKREFEKLDKLSNDFVNSIIEKLSEKEIDKLCASMNTILKILDKETISSSSDNYEIHEAYTDLKNVKKLFTEYTSFLGVNLSFQHYDSELKDLPGKYSKPDGRLYTLYFNKKLAGCIALRKLNKTDCEIKRLFVRPEFRGHHFGHILMNKVIEEAKTMNYKYAYFDTLESLHSAVRMYDSMGAERIPPYYNNPLEGVIYYRIKI